MKISKANKLELSFIVLFFTLNIINTYFLTTSFLNKYISPFKHTFSGELNAFVGNFAMLLLVFLIVNLIFKKVKSKMIVLSFITLLLNLLIFALGFFTLFYGTAFASNALDIFRNPAEGISHGMFGVVMSELFLYFRFLIFFPSIILFIIYFLFKKEVKKGARNKSFIRYNIKHHLSMGFAFILLITLSLITFQNKFRKSELSIGATISTHAVQNLGVYPFYASNLFGLDFNVTSRKTLNLETEEDLFDAYNKYNKNKISYTNEIDGKQYSNQTYYNNQLVNGIFKDKNLILVHLESINQFLFDLEDAKARMPFIQALLSESYVFDNYYTSVGMGVSADAELSVLTGLYMNGHSTLYWDYENNKYDLDTIPKLFAKQNYKSLSVHGDYEDFYNRKNAYEGLIGFTEPYRSLEWFAKQKGLTTKELVEFNLEIGYEGRDGIMHKSPWVSDLETSNVVRDTSVNFGSQKHLIFNVNTLPHTPFQFDPYKDINRPEYNKYDSKLKSLTRNYLDFADYLDDITKRLFYENGNLTSNIEDNVYIFYGDHGSSLKNGDLSVLFDNLDTMEERAMLQQVAAFIYAPGNKEVKIEKQGNEYTLKEGIIKGNQPLVRSHIDMYRTIVDLFDLFDPLDKSQFYFGVNGFSKEPTYAFDNRIQDLVVDNKNKDGFYITSLRNTNNVFPRNTVIDELLIKDIIKFKHLSDLLLINEETYKDVKYALQNN